MKIRYGMPKYQRAWSGLFALGLGLGLFARYIGPAEWISGLAWVAIAAGMSVLVAGLVAERKEWERQHPKTHETAAGWSGRGAAV